MIASLFVRIRLYLLECVTVLLCTAIFLAFLFHNVFTDPYYYFAADISELYFPWWIFLNTMVHAGQLPFLNPYWFGGSLPFAALESSAFYPPYLIAQLFFTATENLNVAYAYFMSMELGHYLLASVTFWFLARRTLRLSRFAALFGAVTYASSGVFIGRFVHPVVIQSLAWLPLVYAFYLLWLERGRWLYALATALVLALIVVSGHPHIVFQIYMLFGLAAVYWWVMRPGKRLVIAMVSIAIVVLSIALTAERLLLTGELAGHVVRTTNETTVKNLYNSLHPYYYLTMLVPYLFGRHQIGYWGSDYPWGNWENFLYIGIIPFLFLPFFLRWERKAHLGFFSSGALVMIFLLLGKYFFFSAWVNQHLPFAETTTTLSKMTNYLHFFLVVLATIGIHVATETKNRRSTLSIFLGTVAILGVVLWRLTPADSQLIPNITSRAVPNEQALAFIAANIVQAKTLFIFSVLAVFLLLLYPREWLRTVVIIVYALDIFLSGGAFNPIERSPGPPQRYFGSSELTTRLQGDAHMYRVDGLSPRNLNMIAGIETTYGYHTIETDAYHRAMQLFRFENRQLLNLMNVKYFFSDRDLSLEPGMVNVGVNLWENQQVFPRAFFVSGVRVVHNAKEMATAVTDPAFDPKTEVVLLADAPTASVLSPRLPEDVPVVVEENLQSHLRVSVDAPVSGYIVFATYQYPGWNVTVDGRKTALLPANLSFYAVPVTSGKHIVLLSYRSSAYVMGSWIALIGWGGLALMLGHPRFRQRLFRPNLSQ